MSRFLNFFFAIITVVTQCAEPEPDGDNDGLSDFLETHKYFTDPRKPDSDNDGIPDSDWLERREYQYTVRAVVQVMNPVTPKYLNNDYQDVRILDETEYYTELEVILYPFNTIASTIKGNPNWRDSKEQMKGWIEPARKSDWSDALRSKMKRALKDSGIDIEDLDDKTIAEKASSWLIKRTRSQSRFSSFIADYGPLGEPFVPESLSKAAVKRLGDGTLQPLSELWHTGNFRRRYVRPQNPRWLYFQRHLPQWLLKSKSIYLRESFCVSRW